MELAISNVVVISPLLIPARFTQMFFIKAGVIEENEWGDGSIFSDQVCQFQTNEFQFVVINGQIQFSVKPDVQGQSQIIIEKLGGIVKALGECPLIAAGVNFMWTDGNEEGFVHTETRRMFYKEGIAPFTFFADGNARFGSYMSKDFRGTRLKLEIKPVLLQSTTDPSQTMHSISFAFNFHKDLHNEDNPVTTITETLRQWDDFRREAEGIAMASLRGGE